MTILKNSSADGFLHVCSHPCMFTQYIGEPFLPKLARIVVLKL